MIFSLSFNNSAATVKLRSAKEIMPAIKHPIEYRLLVQPTFDTTKHKDGIIFLLETSKQFTNFSYIIDVKESVEGKKIVWILHGLRAPSMNMPSTGNAQYRSIYYDLGKEMDFTLIKKEKVEASVSLKFLRSSVKSSASIVNFLKIYTDEHEFINNRMTDADVPENKPDVHREHAASKKLTNKKKKV
ncbi:MAG TPA: hypothetical protein DCQ28_01740 [Bacteroidetes bacterium]|nr:hypothetical protein [Bacteroidota bacterium]